MANYKGSNPFKIPRPISLPGGWNAESLTTDKTLTLKDSIAQALDPGGGNKSDQGALLRHRQHG